MDVQTALFLERARVLQQWSDNMLVIKESYSKDVAIGKRDLAGYLPVYIQWGAR